MKLTTIIKDTDLDIDDVVLSRHNLSKKEVNILSIIPEKSIR